MKTKVVVINEDGARIYTNPDNIEELEKTGKVFINPNVSHLRGVSPTCWTYDRYNQIIAKRDLITKETIRTEKKQRKINILKIFLFMVFQVIISVGLYFALAYRLTGKF